MSSVSRSSPQHTVKRYRLRPSITKGTVLVASPSAIGRPPEASGSSVPAWPVRAVPDPGQGLDDPPDGRAAAGLDADPGAGAPDAADRRGAVAGRRRRV